MLPDDCKDLWASLYRLRGTAVDESSFRQHMIECQERFEVLDEGRALRVLSGEENLLHPGVWITFDDAYADVLEFVDPVLQELRIPATVFAATAVMDGRWLPADRWYAAVATARRRRGHIYNGADSWSFDLDNPETLARLVDGPEKRGYLRAAPALQEMLLAELSEALESDPQKGRLYLNAAELAQCSSGLWSVGSHTVSHSLLPGLSDQEVHYELTESRSELELITGKSPLTFAYPDGRWDNRITGLVREAGYAAALTLIHDEATSKNDPCCLPRFLARNEPDFINRLFNRRMKCS
ncbi:polysaccharide deacetylase family protein [Myxococcota bacterium]|nr:polysaccharide deacetylase family protein [Myxococcota bacterium]